MSCITVVIVEKKFNQNYIKNVLNICTFQVYSVKINCVYIFTFNFAIYLLIIQFPSCFMGVNC